MALATFVAAALGFTAGAVDQAALRAVLRVPYVPEAISLDLPAVRSQRAIQRLAKLNPELLADRDNPRLCFRVAAHLREMGDPASREYARRAVTSLLAGEKQKPLEEDQLVLLIEALIASGEFDEAAARAENPILNVAAAHVLRGEIGLFRVFEAADVSLKAPGGDRMLHVSLEALRNPEDAPKWSAWLDDSTKQLRKAAQGAPKDPRAHRSLAVALVTSAYVSSAIKWRTEQATANLMPTEAFAHFKEAANLAPEDVVAQWEAYESRTALERGKGAANAAALPKDARRYVATLAARLEAIAGTEQSDAAIASEILGVILAQGDKPAEALPWLAKGRSEANSARIDWLRCRLLIALGKPDAAIGVGEPLLATALMPDLALAMAAAYEVTGQIVKADELILASLARYPGSIDLRLARAVTLLRDPTGEGLLEAGQSLNRLTQIGETDLIADELRFVRAVYFGLIGDFDAANRLADALAKKMPGRVEKLRKALG